jgi:hypothetical protein
VVDIEVVGAVHQEVIMVDGVVIEGEGAEVAEEAGEEEEVLELLREQRTAGQDTRRMAKGA